MRLNTRIDVCRVLPSLCHATKKSSQLNSLKLQNTCANDEKFSYHTHSCFIYPIRVYCSQMQSVPIKNHFPRYDSVSDEEKKFQQRKKNKNTPKNVILITASVRAGYLYINKLEFAIVVGPCLMFSSCLVCSPLFGFWFYHSCAYLLSRLYHLMTDHMKN